MYLQFLVGDESSVCLEHKCLRCWQLGVIIYSADMVLADCERVVELRARRVVGVNSGY
jgi:hypothetical protein